MLEFQANGFLTSGPSVPTRSSAGRWGDALNDVGAKILAGSGGRPRKKKADAIGDTKDTIWLLHIAMENGPWNQMI
jgi:hypothetical protein